MNTTQKNYVQKRVSDILNRKRREITKKYTVEMQPLTVRQLVVHIKTGRIKIAPGRGNDLVIGSSYGRTPYLHTIFKIDEKKYPLHRTITDQKKVNAECAKLEAKGRSIQDEMVLGDEIRALKLLKDFDK